jgi:hypothetical protein
MELVGFVRSLLRRKAVVGAILGLAIFAAFLTAFKVGPGGVERRSTAVGAATSQILVDSAQSTLVEGAGSDQLAALGTRASVYAQYLSSRDAVVKISRDIGVDPNLVTAHGPFSQGTGLQDYDQQGAESRASDLVEEGKSYRLVFQAQEDVPIITVYATAPTVAGALDLAHSSFKVLSDYIDGLKQGAEKASARDRSPEPAVVSSELLINDIIVRQLGRPEGGLVGGAANLMLMVLAFAGVLGIGCLAFAVGSGFLRHWRLAGEMERFDAQAQDWNQEAAARMPLDPAETAESRERWRLLHPGDQGPNDAEHESGPAVTGL